MFEAADGFDDADLEKPNFPGKSTSTKVPYVLSDPDKTPVVQVPSTINQYLRKYQRDGISFLYKQYCHKKGAILADDMGLGKTVQVIGFMSAVLGKTGTKSDIYGKFSSIVNEINENYGKERGAFLIVSPHSVLYNWHEELVTWGYFKVGKFHKNKRDETLERASKQKLDVVLTTYETLRNHWKSLNQIEWLALIMDEVHHLKDPKAAVTIAAKSLNVKCRIGLTGTPLQNRFLEFWCVLDWANPGCLDDKDVFADRYCKPIMQGQRFDVTKRELATGRKRSREFQSMLDGWCLRRTKSLISDELPRKDQKVVFCPLSKVQEDIYKTLLQTPDVQLVLKQGEPCDCRSERTRGQCCYLENEDGYTMKQLTLQYLRLLLKVSNHAALLLPQIKQTDEQRKRAGALCAKIFSVHPSFKEASELPSIEVFSDDNFCGKMKVLAKLFKLFLSQRDKVLLFSYSAQLLDILEAYVVSCGMVYRRLDGKTRGEHRLNVVREFNTVPDIFLFLVSTKAGGVGLNLTSANVVIVFDPSWNPADDLQAEDRAYRIGQRKDVKVFRLICAGTVEENIYLRQVYKQQLANVALEGNNERRYFTAVEGEKDKKGELFGIENLFALRNDGCVSTDIFMRSDTVEKGFKMAKYELLPERYVKNQTRTVDECDEVSRYGLDDVASQLVEDDGYEQKPNDEVNTKNSATEADSSATVYTKIKKVPRKSELPVGKRCQIKESWKARKNQKGPPKSEDTEIDQILVDCGVQHAHSNKSIVGSSKAENQMTAQALKEVFQLGQYSQQPANCFTGIDSDSEESDDVGNISENNTTPQTSETKRLPNFDSSIQSGNKTSVGIQSSITKFGSTAVLVGKTPKAIRLRQFSELAEYQDCQTQVDFAKFVLSCTATEQKELLAKYYKYKRYPVESVSCSPKSIKHSKKDTKSPKKTLKNRNRTLSGKPSNPPSSAYFHENRSSNDLRRAVSSAEQNGEKTAEKILVTEHAQSPVTCLSSTIDESEKASEVDGVTDAWLSSDNACASTTSTKHEENDVYNEITSSTFLDTFLDDCFKQTYHKATTHSGSEDSFSSIKTSRKHNQTSVIDDLI